MKKSILILIFAFISAIGFSQSIDFELKKTNPASVSLDSETGNAKITIGFTIGVVGVPDSYGMVTGATIEVTVLSYVNKTVSQTNTEVMTAVATYIATNYPDIP